jgi:hypothetical protein
LSRVSPVLFAWAEKQMFYDVELPLSFIPEEPGIVSIWKGGDAAFS